VADRTLNRGTVAWALGRALRLAVATCVVALLLATTLSGAAAERFATTAYLAAIFAAAALALGRFLPAPARVERRTPSSPFPAFLGYTGLVVLFLSVAAGFVSQPGAEAVALAAGAALVVIAVLVRSGALREFNAALARGGVTVAGSRYAVAIALSAFAIGALVGAYNAEGIVTFGYRFAVIATLFVAATLLTPTSAGVFAKTTYVRTIDALDRLARNFVFERTASVAAIVTVAGFVAAAVIPWPFGEAFAVLGYVGAVATALSLILGCRRLRS
jgi:hypothetical protein